MITPDEDEDHFWVRDPLFVVDGDGGRSAVPIFHQAQGSASAYSFHLPPPCPHLPKVMASEIHFCIFAGSMEMILSASLTFCPFSLHQEKNL